MKETPHIDPALIQWLETMFTPVTDSRNIELREIDFRSGQHSVVTFLKQQQERQVANGRQRS